MREAAFLKLNSHKWKEFETILEHSGKNPDHLAELYIELTDDLSFARTYYPDSTTTLYLNTLLARVHGVIYKNKKEHKSKFISFWKTELPLLTARYHRQLLYSFLIFTVAVLIGAVSARFDDSYVRLVFGDEYVNMTIRNIENNDPMAVYKSMESSPMFLYITFNNIYVSFLTFVSGVLSSVGTGYMLFQNGLMLGAFQYFFYSKHLFLTSFLSIWIHGTIEIASVILAGTAGMVMGNSILFPGTYSRLESFRRGAGDGMKLVIGLVPLFVIAGFLEGFVTRHTEWPEYLKMSIIACSAFFILFYFVLYPIMLKRNYHEPSHEHGTNGE
jgi:uncharacterized membrane protein SpoIIM required for sporulation